MRFSAISIFCILAAVEINVCRKNPGRIIGGARAYIENYPYQVSLQYFGRHHCGAAIISAFWIITAAHCVHGRDDYLFTVRIGSSTHEYGGKVHEVKSIIIHRRYNTSNLDYDIALVRVTPTIKIGTNTVNSIALASVKDNRTMSPGTRAIITGWGVYGELGFRKTPEHLRAVKVRLVDNEQCAKLLTPYPITARMLCAGSLNGGKDACQGDSGGPLVLRDILIGIVSWGDGCAKPNKAGVYSNIAYFRKWIDSSSGV